MTTSRNILSRLACGITVAALLPACGGTPEPERIAEAAQQSVIDKIIWTNTLGRMAMRIELMQWIKRLGLDKPQLPYFPPGWQPILGIGSTSSLATWSFADPGLTKLDPGLPSFDQQALANGASVGFVGLLGRAPNASAAVPAGLYQLRLRKTNDAWFADWGDLRRGKVALSTPAKVYFQPKAAILGALITLRYANGYWQYDYHVVHGEQMLSIETTIAQVDLEELLTSKLPPNDGLVQAERELRAGLGAALAELDATHDDFELESDFAYASREGDMIVNAGRAGLEKIMPDQLDKGALLGIASNMRGNAVRLDKLEVQGPLARWIPLGAGQIVVIDGVERETEVGPLSGWRGNAVGAELDAGGLAVTHAWSLGDMRVSVESPLP